MTCNKNSRESEDFVVYINIKSAVTVRNGLHHLGYLLLMMKIICAVICAVIEPELKSNQISHYML